MTEWHITPDYIANNWSNELFEVMVNKLVERKQKESGTGTGVPHVSDNIVSDESLFKQLGAKIKRVK